MSGILLANPTGAFVDKSKGSMANRAKCSIAHTLNSVGTGATTGAAILGATIIGGGIAKRGETLTATVGAIRNAKGVDKFGAALDLATDKVASLTKNSKLVNKGVSKLSKFYDKIINGIYQCASKISNKTVNVVRNSKGQFTGTLPEWLKGARDLSKNKKAGIVLAIGGALVATVIGLAKFVHKRGQIDQKYTDKAKLEAVQI